MSEHDDHIEKSPAPGVTLDNIGSHLRPRDPPRLPHRSADHSLLGPGLPGTWPPMTLDFWLELLWTTSCPRTLTTLPSPSPPSSGPSPDHCFFYDPIKADQSDSKEIVLIMTELHVKDIFRFWHNFWLAHFDMEESFCESLSFSLASSTTWLKFSRASSQTTLPCWRGPDKHHAWRWWYIRCVMFSAGISQVFLMAFLFLLGFLFTRCLVFSSLPSAHLVPILCPQARCIASPARERKWWRWWWW